VFVQKWICVKRHSDLKLFRNPTEQRMLITAPKIFELKFNGGVLFTRLFSQWPSNIYDNKLYYSTNSKEYIVYIVN